MNEQQPLTDVTEEVGITINHTRFTVRRSDLMRESGYFRAMFRSQLLESCSDDVVISGPIDDEITPEVMAAVISFVELGKLPVCECNVGKLLLAADYFDIENR